MLLKEGESEWRVVVDVVGDTEVGTGGGYGRWMEWVGAQDGFDNRYSTRQTPLLARQAQPISVCNSIKRYQVSS